MYKLNIFQNDKKGYIADFFQKECFTATNNEIVNYDTMYLYDKELSLDDNSSNWTIPDIYVKETISEIEWSMVQDSLFNSLYWETLKTGEISPFEEKIRELFSRTSKDEVLKRLNNFYLEHADNLLFICSLLQALSHMEYENVIPNAPTIAMACLSNEDDRVVEYAIKAFANWNNKRTLICMKPAKPRKKWAEKEWKMVIKYIEDNGDD